MDKKIINNYTNFKKISRHIFIHKLKLKASIGIFEHEKNNKQLLIISIDLEVTKNINYNDDIKNVVNYKKIIDDIKKLINSGHILLVETLVEKIADKCFKFKNVIRVFVKLEKPEAFTYAKSVGVTIEYIRT